MLKKDYELIAYALNLTLRQHTNAGNAVPRAFIHRLLGNFIDVFSGGAGNFNRTTFLNAVAKDLSVTFGDER